MSEAAARWRRSSFCANAGCAEIKIDRDTVSLRSSERPELTVELTKAEWEAFKKGIVAGEF
ncbi:DUF397 domain-containing protein [Actinoplanes sp. KI2]|uniref:DUF397 domain-containing protein n=1 Tax=Actinoplanes sp. KI2 TaxID=2983315 RepID=UPI0021D5A004|nr:DUF397 domain-containing protein [Actinoplanes sp. KI2]MCU7728782.1 DUF397 domain-containing protein [Actinoplanes sp. KI2]